jgi:hypothetical protein
MWVLFALFPPFLCLGPVRNHLFSHPRPCRTVCPHPKASSHQCLFRCRQSTRTVVLLAPLSANSILARPTQNPGAMFSRNQSMCSTECDEALNNPGRGLAVRSTRGNCGRNTKVIDCGWPQMSPHSHPAQRRLVYAIPLSNREQPFKDAAWVSNRLRGPGKAVGATASL